MLECKQSLIHGEFSNSRADNSESSGPISPTIELIQDLMVIYTLTKFGADWLTFVDARVLTRNLWTDGHRRTVSDHNHSLSISCSDELKRSAFRVAIFCFNLQIESTC